jgi:WD40 repeat protein
MIWHTASGTLYKDLRVPGNPLRLLQTAFSPDGKLLAVACSDPTKVIVWNTADWSIAQHGELPRANDRYLAFSPDGRWLSWITRVFPDPAAAADQNSGYATLTTLEVATGKTREIRTDKGKDLKYLAYSPDSRFLTTAQFSWDIGEAEEVVLFDAVTGEKKTTLKPAAQGKEACLIYSCGFSADSSKLICAYYPAGLTAWDVHTGEVKLRKTLPPSYEFMRFIDGSKALSDDASNGIQLWDTRQLLSAEKPLPRATFYWLEGGKWLVTTPRGYFDCSPGMNDTITWKAGGKIYPYAKLERAYHRPDLVRRALNW